MGGGPAPQAVTLTQPRDRLQTQFVEKLARPVGPGDAAEKVADLVALIGKADLSEAQRLSKRLKSDTDRLGHYFRSRFGPVGQSRVTESLADRILAQRGAEPDSRLRISTPGTQDLPLRPSSAAGPLISALQMPVPGGSTERFRTIHKIFQEMDLFSAVRLLERLRQPGDRLRALFLRKLSSDGSTYLIEKVLAQSVQGLSVDDLPESVTSDQLRNLMNRGQIKDAQTGKVLPRETRQLHDAVFRESPERGDAFTPATPNRLQDMTPEARYPNLSANAIRAVIRLSGDHQSQLVPGRYLGGDKEALSGFPAL